MPNVRKKNPNLLFILSDQHRYNVWGKYNSIVQTPNLDRLAEQGITFHHDYTVAQPCAPARASLLTGRYAELHRVWGNDECLPAIETTWADVLHRFGYHTLAVGRTHNIHQGFELVRVPYGNSFPMLDYSDVHQIPWGPQGFISPSPVAVKDYYETKVARTAVELLEDVSRNQPFAMYVGFQIPHPPFVIPEPFNSMYRPEDMILEPNGQPPDSENIARMVDREFGRHLTEGAQRRMQAVYYGMVSLLDESVGIILDGLHRLGLEENTLVVYTSDHGEQMGHRGLWNKGFGYDPSFRVPLLMSRPGTVPAGIDCGAMVESVDLFPTILDALDIPEAPRPTGRSGRSFWHLALSGEERPHRGWVYGSVSNGMGRIYRDSNWKLWYEIEKNLTIAELYNLADDPHELRNVFDDETCRETRDGLLRKLLDFSITGLHETASVLYPEGKQEAGFNGQFRTQM